MLHVLIIPRINTAQDQSQSSQCHSITFRTCGWCVALLSHAPTFRPLVLVHLFSLDAANDLALLSSHIQCRVTLLNCQSTEIAEQHYLLYYTLDTHQSFLWPLSTVVARWPTWVLTLSSLRCSNRPTPIETFSLSRAQDLPAHVVFIAAAAGVFLSMNSIRSWYMGGLVLVLIPMAYQTLQPCSYRTAISIFYYTRRSSDA